MGLSNMPTNEAQTEKPLIVNERPETVIYGHHYSPDNANYYAPQGSSLSNSHEHNVSRHSGSNSSRSLRSDNVLSETQATSLELPPLQAQSILSAFDLMQPVEDATSNSFDLVAPPDAAQQSFSLERQSEKLFSLQHLEAIFSSPTTLLKFSSFLGTHRPQSVPLLIYYLDALKALKAISYSNAITEALSPIPGSEFTYSACTPTANVTVERQATQAFQSLADNDLPAYITQMYIQVVTQSMTRRIVGNLPSHLLEASEGLAEVFCLTDPSRADNPIVFASEEFNLTTQYGLSYVIGRNCRFLQGPKTNDLSIKRLRQAVKDCREHSEVLLNYRRDGSPFMNLLMTAPLCDNKGIVRYFIGAQIDVSGLVQTCTDMDAETFGKLLQDQCLAENRITTADQTPKDGFQEMVEMFNSSELETVRRSGGRMHREYREDSRESSQKKVNHMPRLHLGEDHRGFCDPAYGNGRLQGVYRNYVLIRPAPSLRILFASPSLRTPGILQTPFMEKIGGSSRVRGELLSAFAEGRGVTAKIRWLARTTDNGRNRWIHCTPLIGSNGKVGVWMVVIVDDQEESSKGWKQAPPVASSIRGDSTINSRPPSRSQTEADGIYRESLSSA